MWFKSSVAGTKYLLREGVPWTPNSHWKHEKKACSFILKQVSSHNTALIFIQLPLQFLFLSSSVPLTTSSSSPSMPFTLPSASVSHLLLPSSSFPFSCHPPVFLTGHLHRRWKHIHTYPHACIHTRCNHIPTLHQTVVFASVYFQVFLCFIVLVMIWTVIPSSSTSVLKLVMPSCTGGNKVPITGSQRMIDSDQSLVEG